jgi:sulfonate transport system substrate-binding protein
MRPTTSTLARLAAALLLLASARARAAEPVKIRIGWIVAVANWPSILMEKPGLARHAGKSYVLEPVRFQGTPTEITALANGELEIADLAFSSFALAVENAGMDDLRIIADEFQDGAPGYYTDEFFVLKDGPIRTVKDLKGKVLATNAAGSAVDIVMRAMLRRNGLDEKKDVTFVEAAFPNMRAMLAENKVALIPGVVPFSLDPQLRAIARPLFTQKEAVGRTQMLVWTARAGFLEKHRAAVLDFLEDALRAVRFYVDPRNHDEAVQIASRVSKQPPDKFQEWLFTKKDYYRDPGLVPDLEALQANIDLARDLGLLKASLDVKKHADLSLVREAAARLR